MGRKNVYFWTPNSEILAKALNTIEFKQCLVMPFWFSSLQKFHYLFVQLIDNKDTKDTFWDKNNQVDAL